MTIATTKRTLPIGLAAVLAAAVLTAPRHGAAQTRELGGSGELLDGIAALVEEGVVLRSEFEQRVATVTDNLLRSQAQLPPEQRGALPPLSVIEEQVLEQLILEQIQLQRANRFGIIVGDEMLNQAMASIAQGVGLTLDQFPQALAVEGIDYARYREETRQTLILEQLVQREVGGSIVVAPRDMEMCLAQSTTDEYLNQEYNTSHLLIGISSTATRDEIEQAREQVRDILERLEAGESFADLAITYSDGQNALEGGSLGCAPGHRDAEPVRRTHPGHGAGRSLPSDPERQRIPYHQAQRGSRRGAGPSGPDEDPPHPAAAQ